MEGGHARNVKGLPFTATCILAKNARTLYGMVPRELRMIDEAPQALTAAVNGRDIGPGDRIEYATGVMGDDTVKGVVEQVVRGGENWAFVLRVEQADADSIAILVTEPRIGALKSLETPENDTKNNTKGGDTPGDSEATLIQAIVNAVNAFAYTGANGVTWTARLVGCDETTPGTYAVEAALNANDERAGSLDFDIADGVFINRLAIPEGDAKTMVWQLIEHLSTTLGKRLVFSGQGVQSYALARAGLNGDVPALYAGMDERNVRNLVRGNATKATVGEFFARLKGAEGTEPFTSPYEVAGAGRDQTWIVPADEERWPLSLAQGQPMWLGKLAMLSTQWAPELPSGPKETKVRTLSDQVRTAHAQWIDSKATDPGLDFGWPTDDGDLYWADDDDLWSQIERIQQQSPEEIAEAWKRISTAAELTALVMSRDAAEELRLARDAGVLPFELDGVIGFAQESRYHDLALDEHLIESVGAAAKRGAPLEVRLALLFHDAGKPESAWRSPDGRLHYYSNVREGKQPHEITSARLARKALVRLGYEHETVEHVAKLIEAHMFQDYREPVSSA